MIKISDNTEITLSEINHPVINELTNKSLSTLDQERFIIFPPLLKDSDDLDEGNCIFRTFNGKTMTCNIVGFLSDGNNEIHIHSRFFETEDEDYFLDYMLQKVLHYNVTVNEIASSEETTYYDLLVYLFPYYWRRLCERDSIRSMLLILIMIVMFEVRWISIVILRRMCLLSVKLLTIHGSFHSIIK